MIIYKIFFYIPLKNTQNKQKLTPKILKGPFLLIGPLDKTVGTFWKMVWEKKSSTVVMLTKTFDFIRGK